jgi:hypothetical protein
MISGAAARQHSQRERSEQRARATGPYISSPQPGESGGYCRKTSAIRAAFRARLKPAIIARQFGVPQSVVRQVLQGEGRL